MDPDKTSNQFPLELAPDTRRALLESALGGLEDPSSRASVALKPQRWGREHTVLLAAAACGVATSAVYVLSMLTGISPFDAGDVGDDSPLSQSAGEMLAIAELAFLALVASWATWSVIRRM